MHVKTKLKVAKFYPPGNYEEIMCILQSLAYYINEKHASRKRMQREGKTKADS